jgi:hypothetical protein
MAFTSRCSVPAACGEACHRVLSKEWNYCRASDLGWAQRRHWAAEVATAAKHAMSQAAHASRVLSPAHDIDPVDIACVPALGKREWGGAVPNDIAVTHIVV